MIRNARPVLPSRRKTGYSQHEGKEQKAKQRQYADHTVDSDPIVENNDGVFWTQMATESTSLPSGRRSKLPRVLDIMQSVFTKHFLELKWEPLETESVLRDFVQGESCPACGKTSGSRSMEIENLQCRVQRCRRMLLDGLLDKLAPDLVRAADEDDRTARLTKCTKARFC